MVEFENPARSMDRIEKRIGILRKTVMVENKMINADVKFRFTGIHGNIYLLIAKGLYTRKRNFRWILGMRRYVWVDKLELHLEKRNYDDEITKPL
jgi:hypothetical protein